MLMEEMVAHTLIGWLLLGKHSNYHGRYRRRNQVHLDPRPRRISVKPWLITSQ